MFPANELKPEEVRDISLRNLAHLGDAVFELYEREKELMKASTTKNIHLTVVSRVNAQSQAQLLEQLTAYLSEKEINIVRRARNIKVSNYKKVDQSVYRRSTAFEALIGFLYLTDSDRLKEVLALTEIGPEKENLSP